MTADRASINPKLLAEIQLGFELPAECEPGVATNLALLCHHRGVLESFDAGGLADREKTRDE